MTLAAKKGVLQFIKYVVVGCINTAITLIVIFVCKSLLNIDPYIANAIGYAVGLINSFIWNKNWVFKSQNGYSREAIKFGIGFALCYLLQLGVVYALNSTTFGTYEWQILGIFTISGYGVATLLGSVAYTVVNYIYNRVVTFK